MTIVVNGVSTVTLGCRLSLWGVDCHFWMSTVTLECRLSLWSVDCHFGVSTVTLGCRLSLWGVDCHFGMSSVTLGCRLSLCKDNLFSIAIYFGHYYFAHIMLVAEVSPIRPLMLMFDSLV